MASQIIDSRRNRSSRSMVRAPLATGTYLLTRLPNGPHGLGLTTKITRQPTKARWWLRIFRNDHPIAAVALANQLQGGTMRFATATLASVVALVTTLAFAQ